MRPSALPALGQPQASGPGGATPRPRLNGTDASAHNVAPRSLIARNLPAGVPLHAFCGTLHPWSATHAVPRLGAEEASDAHAPRLDHDEREPRGRAVGNPSPPKRSGGAALPGVHRLHG